MASDLEYLLIIDVEATCWEGKPPQGQVSEIIEIGICTFDIPAWVVVDAISLPVTPSLSSCSSYCTNLTGWTDDKLVAVKRSFSDACNILTTLYNSRRRAWASWGDYDRMQFERDCNRKQVAYPFGPTHINLKNMFAIRHGLPQEIGMKAALDKISMLLEGQHHSGVDDARNVARILEKMGRI
jgi:inhibitor of KinA sporulation pathway (predicted exonuclease)